MGKSLIPLRPKEYISSLTQDEQSALTWLILSGCSRREAFLAFARPDLSAQSNKAIFDSYMKEFFAQKSVREYMDAYSKTIDEFLHPAPVKVEPEGTVEERKAAAKARLVEFLIDKANQIREEKDPELVLKMVDKAGFFDFDEHEEGVRRYLPQDCNSCAYRQFCEDNTVDLCTKCKYRKFGEENGIHYEKKDLLENDGTDIASE